MGFPALEARCVKEFLDMHVRDLIPRNFHHTILKIRSSCTILVRSQLYCRILWFFSQDLSLFCKFACFRLFQSARRRCQISLNFRSVLMMVHLEQADLQKTCPDVPNEFRVSGSKQESRLINFWDSENSWVDWERGIIQSCSQFQDHRHISNPLLKQFTLSCNS